MRPLLALGIAVGLLLARPARAALPDRLQVVADDVELAERIARSARHEHPGGVEVAPGPAGRTPPRTLRLTVRRGPGRLWLVLSLRGALRVQRAVALSGSPSRLDLAEAAAISLSELRARLEELQAARAAEEPADEPPGPEGARPPPAATRPAPAPRLGPATSSAPRLGTEPGPAPRLAAARPSPWRLAVGVPLTVLGGAALALGATSVALDGRCFDPAVPCAYRYDTLRPGLGELVAGGAALAAGVALVALDLRARQGARRIALGPGPGLGLLLAGDL